MAPGYGAIARALLSWPRAEMPRQMQPLPGAQRSCKMRKEAREREHMIRRAEVTPNAILAQAHLGDGLARLSKEPGSNSHNNPPLRDICTAEYKKRRILATAV